MTAQNHGVGSVLFLIVVVAIVWVVVRPGSGAVEAISSIGQAFAGLIRTTVGGSVRPRSPARPPRGRTHPNPTLGQSGRAGRR